MKQSWHQSLGHCLLRLMTQKTRVATEIDAVCIGKNQLSLSVKYVAEVDVPSHGPSVESQRGDLLFKHCVSSLVRNDLIQP